MNRKLAAVLFTLGCGLLVLTGSGVAAASTPQLQAAKVTGAPALIIILVILALIIIGVVAVIRFVVRKGKQAL